MYDHLKHEIRRENSKNKTEDTVDGCYEQILEDGGTGKRERWSMTEDDSEEPSKTVATPDDGTSLREDGKRVVEDVPK